MVKQDTAFLQNWLRTVVMAPGFLKQKVGLANHTYNVSEDDVVSDEGKASIYARLNVYSSGYMLRLLDCMYADYAISKKFMGDELFDSFAKAYLMYHPSTSFTLYDLGKAFPDFLEKTKPQSEEGTDNAYFDIPATLARVERARQVAMRAPGTEGEITDMNPVNIQDMFFSKLNISIPECLQLLELNFPMKEFFESVYREGEYELPSPQKTFMAISRKNYRIVLEEITEMQFLLLQECKNHTNLYEAISALSNQQNVSSADLLADAYLWIAYFRKCGFIQVVS
ncbi:HvfC/BufC N-terminal domain-containing protein [Mucilaginibacter aquariorum]|uniref:DNA-binding domain-containing protein n=1 Tax=Mucilaginibacter aquariorum TaxID=2967225 RepID=A0ABT1SXM9_9SPHI|nr:DNA-binding domain-containing protein [Mucilaginibacter aquariorum]MCQ6957099.1 DNA-binding domain-containing protein [Mucilaginibacter aquariorum]